jgi:thiamine pyrophosphate-dependent acetolactate synthase large subunit-like protein
LSDRLTEGNGKGIHSVAVFDALGNIVSDETIVVVYMGNNTYSFGRYLKTKGTQRVIVSVNLATNGFGFPAGMGASAAIQSWCNL